MYVALVVKLPFDMGPAVLEPRPSIRLPGYDDEVSLFIWT